MPIWSWHVFTGSERGTLPIWWIWTPWSFDSSQPNNKAILPLSNSSDMITFTLTTGSLITLRPSRTESKIKYYIELKNEPGKTENDLEQIEAELIN
ncbi:PGM_PMM_IV domain-containing protein [Meloidogyne graminicola]|uniref:PGM_PMM_IV domain-containing protein n=1 Tax=Meloidogyne graminicola TaxID=189291 RepID=A0A8S9ZBF5_9BILA|nr:PGM_PMM_IV domain-containing protein [Meloidogyne graminicola]